MTTPFAELKARLGRALDDKRRDGYDADGLDDELAALPDSYDALIGFARTLSGLPLRLDWPYLEPDGLEDIHAECDPRRAFTPIASVPPADAAPRIRAGFLASVCGCILGKPVEFDPTLADLEAMLAPLGEWPIRDYISEAILPATLARRGEPMPEWNRTYREGIEYVMPDDDLNYTLLGMLLLERHGAGLTTAHVADAWRRHLTVEGVCGPEQWTLADLALRRAYGEAGIDDWIALLSGGGRRGGAHCGAQIRADAYGYACPGDPARAADLAYQDAALTHRGTGLYATCWTAAALAVALTGPDDPLDIFRVALQYVPRRSRFFEAMAAGLGIVAAAPDWRSGYESLQARFPGCGHCMVYLESATLMNTLKFARRVDEGICLQVMQGNDTDSYGATAGALLGGFLGPGTLDEARWLAPFRDDLRTSLAWFDDRSLSSVADRISRLPSRLA